MMGVGSGYDDAGKMDLVDHDDLAAATVMAKTETAMAIAIDASTRAQHNSEKEQQRGDGEHRVKEARWCTMMLARGICGAAAMTAATEVAARSGGRTARPCSAGANIAAAVVDDAATMQ